MKNNYNDLFQSLNGKFPYLYLLEKHFKIDKTIKFKY